MNKSSYNQKILLALTVINAKKNTSCLTRQRAKDYQ